MKIIIDQKNVQEDVLAEFIIALENALPGCKVKVQEVFVLDVANLKAAAVLQSVFGNNGTSSTQEASKAPKDKKAEKKYHKQNMIKIISGPRAGETITGQALGIALRNHTIEVGTRIEHPKFENILQVNTPDDTPDDVPYSCDEVPA